MALQLSLVEIILAITAILVSLVYFRQRKNAKLPPGPPGLPIIGNIHQLGKQPHVQLMKWMKIYGKIFSIKLGLDNAVVINDPKLIKELFNEHAASGRLQNAVFLAISDGKHAGVINTEGQHWEEQRRFVLRKLRDFGFAKSAMEGMILQEVDDVLDWFAGSNGTPVSCYGVFSGAVVNSLWSIVSGEREKSQMKGRRLSKSEILKTSEKMMAALNNATTTGLLFAPVMRFFAPDLSGWRKLTGAVSDMNKHFDKALVKHKANLNHSSPQDLVDHYLIEMNNTKNPSSSFYQQTGEDNLKAIIVDLFQAGTVTTSTTMEWTLLYLSHYPGVQQKLYKEIHAIVGDSRYPSLSDKASLPYTEAVLMEVLRYSTLTPMGVFHKMLEDKMFYGYMLPKNTTIIPNIYGCHYDPEIWGDPENFRPERFLSDDGRRVVRNEALIPFSTGKRQCLGESLARDTLFLFTTRIFQKFEVCPDPDNPKPNFQPKEGFANEPKPFNAIFKPRM